MKRTGLSFIAFAFLMILCLSCSDQKNDLENLPAPTETIVKLDMEDKPKSAARQKWFEAMHPTPEGVIWQDVEYQNSKENAALKLELRKVDMASTRDGIEAVAAGNLTGKWVERGSENQAGSVEEIAYIQETDEIYIRSAGGSIWKSDRFGSEWILLNDDYRFTGDLFDAFLDEQGNVSLIASINGIAHYSEDEGATWIQAEGDLLSLNNGVWSRFYTERSNGEKFFIHQPGWNRNLEVHYSNDDGKTWEEVHSFATGDNRNVAMEKPVGSDNLYALEQASAVRSKAYLYNDETERFEIIENRSPIGFGAEGIANLEGLLINDTLQFFVKDGDDELHVTKDTFKTWEPLSILPSTPWRVGLFIPPSNPERIMYGEVDSYRSVTGGKSWLRMSRWQDYYNDVLGSLHADIMDIEEFVSPEGEPFILVGNHGGISISYDYGETYENIALFGLYISQYYDVATHPEDRSYFYAGAQDQGFQRGRIYQDQISSFDQVISGDYGHIAFTGENNGLWTVYPWGGVSYYPNPKSQGNSDWFTVESPDETVWIPPVVAHPDKSKNMVLVAGGDAFGGSGSKVITMTVDANNNIQADQFAFDFSVSGGTISAIAVSPIDHNYIFVATTNGVIYRSMDAGLSFEEMQVTDTEGHYLYGSCLFPSENDINTVYFSGSGYGNPAVYVSRDAGETFVPMNDGMPSTLAFAVVPNEDESLVFAATESGPYVFITELNEWFPMFGEKTPTERYWAVEYLADLQTVRFATYGRGVWDFELGGEVSTTEEDGLLANVTLYPNPTTSDVALGFEGSHAVVTIYNLEGKVVKTVKNYRKDDRINVSNFTNGLYFAALNIDGKVITKQFVKK